jgi:hypothetical protein
VRRKLLIGGLVTAGLVLIPAASGLGDSSMALDCPPTLGVGCAGVGAVIGTVCYGATPVAVPTIGFVTIQIDSAPSVECPPLPV